MITLAEPGEEVARSPIGGGMLLGGAALALVVGFIRSGATVGFAIFSGAVLVTTALVYLVYVRRAG